MRIVGNTAEASARFGARPHRPSQASEKAEAPVSGRSLVLVEPATAGVRPAASRPRLSAPFLAQMIATRLGLSQTREKRRASFGEAAAVYGAVRPANDGRRKLSCSA